MITRCAQRFIAGIGWRSMTLTLWCLLTAVQPARALTWPGSAPCNASLQVCANAAAPGATVEIATNVPIAESIVVVNAIALVAAPGFKPVFAPGREVSMMPTVGGSVRVAGLTLPGGRIIVNAIGSAPIDIEVERNEIPDVASGPNPSSRNILVQCLDSTHCAAAVRFNRVIHRNAASADFNAAIAAVGPNRGNARMVLRIEGNVVEVQDGSFGIVVSGGFLPKSANAKQVAELPFNVRIGANVVHGGSRGGIHISDDGAVGDAFYELESNLLTASQRGKRDGGGISLGLRDLDGDGERGFVQGIRNTIVDSSCGICVSTDSVADSVAFSRGIIAYNDTPATLSAGAILGNSLLWRNRGVIAGAAPSDIVELDPRFTDRYSGRLRADSPAVDRGDQPGAETVDADGLARTQGAASDWGAIEAGGMLAQGGGFASPSTREHVATAANILGRVTRTTDFEARRRWSITPTFSPWQRGTGAINLTPVGMQYLNNTWGMRNLVDTAMPAGTAFHIFSPVFDTFAVRVHVASAANTSNAVTNISANAAIGRDERLLVTQAWNPTGVAVDNPHPIGINRAGDDWYVVNQDIAAMPPGAAFFVYHQAESRNVYTHVARGANRAGAQTTLDHPLLNGVPCAAPQVTFDSTPGSVFNPHAVAMGYLGGRWYAVNQDGASLPEGAGFTVLVDPKAGERCGDFAFADGFED